MSDVIFDDILCKVGALYMAKPYDISIKRFIKIMKSKGGVKLSEDNLVKLSPPWYTFFNFLKHSIGKDRCVEVLEMKEISDSNFIIQVEVRSLKKALALADILLRCKSFGNIIVRVEVLHCGQAVKPTGQFDDICRVIEVFKDALGTNHYFECIEFRTIFDSEVIFPVFKKEVIQFFNDDLSDLYSNFNGVAAHVFSEVLKEQIGNVSILPSTTRATL